MPARMRGPRLIPVGRGPRQCLGPVAPFVEASRIALVDFWPLREAGLIPPGSRLAAPAGSAASGLRRVAAFGIVPSPGCSRLIGPACRN